MNDTSKLLPRFTWVLTSIAPWLFAFLLVGCNFQAKLPNLPGLNQEAPQISLEIPQGYKAARTAAEIEKSWEQVALDAERMAFSGPAVEKPAVAAVAPVEVAQPRALEVMKPGKISKKLAAKKVSTKKRYASTGKFWKPVKLVKKAPAKKLAANF